VREELEVSPPGEPEPTPNSNNIIYNVNSSKGKRKIKGALAKELWRVFLSGEGVIVFIEGPLGRGKSTYALKVAYQLHGDWDKVLEYLVFTPLQFKDLVERLLECNERVPCIIWDDVCYWLGALKYFSYDPLYSGILGHMNTLRTYTGAIIMTGPHDSCLPRPVLEMGYVYKYKTSIQKGGFDRKMGKPKRKAVTIKRKQRKDGTFYWDHHDKLVDWFYLGTIPEDVWFRYNEIRKSYVELANRMIEVAKKHSKFSILLRIASGELKCWEG